MTGYTVHTGASKKFVAGWDRIFSGIPDEQSSEKAPKPKGKKSKKSEKAVPKGVAGKKKKSSRGKKR